MADRLYVVYLLTINGLPYVGQTCNVKLRRRQHFKALRRGTHQNPKMQQAANLYGLDTAEFTIIESEISYLKIGGRERYWIKFHNAEEVGLNQTGHTKTSCCWNGVEYPSLAAAAAANSVSPPTMRARINAGYTCDGELSEWCKYTERRPCVWNGVEYSSVGEAARANNLSHETMRKRVKAGHTKDSDLYYLTACTWNGIQYASVAEAASANGVARDCMWHRLERGCTCDGDMTRTGGKVTCVWNGIEYQSIAEAARAINVPKTTMEKRLKLGHTCDSDLYRTRQRPRKQAS